MSQFSQFFNQAAGAAAGVAGNIFASIRPPKFSPRGNSHNFNKLANWATENFLVPNHPGLIIGINQGGVPVTVATWENTLVWQKANNDIPIAYNSPSIRAFFYNHVLDKWYIVWYAFNGSVPAYIMYEANILNGQLTNIGHSSDFEDILSLSLDCACQHYCNAEGLYEWHDASYKKIWKYSQTFAKVQSRSLLAGTATDDSKWYYTEDCKIRVMPITSFVGQGSTYSGTTVTPDFPLLLIERYGSRRLVQITAEMVFSARDITGAAKDFWTPMAPDITRGAFFGDAVRLGRVVRNSATVADVYLLDRVDYDRWLNDVADALGMPQGQAFFGDWVNV